MTVDELLFLITNRLSSVSAEHVERILLSTTILRVIRAKHSGIMVNFNTPRRSINTLRSGADLEYFGGFVRLLHVK